MSVLFRRAQGDTVQQLVAPRPIARPGTMYVDGDSALRHSAVWACLRLRADLISTMPVDELRRVGGIQRPIEPKDQFLIRPDGERDVTDWMYASQVDLDRYGNCFGLHMIGQTGMTQAVDLWPAGKVTVRGNGNRVTAYRYEGKEFTPDQVWHERQFTVAGLPVGLSPIVYGAMSIGGYLSAQQFAADWFNDGAQPSGTLRNTEEDRLSELVITTAKDKFKQAVANRDLFVTGKDWEFSPASVDAAGAAFLDEMRYGVIDVARFFGVPSDMIDAESTTSGTKITYANVTQRNLQLLVMNLGPAIIRREAALSAALYGPRYVKLNTDAILRMDPAQRAGLLASQVAARLRTPTEAREADNLAPFTPDQIAEFAALYGEPNRTPTPPPGGGA